MFRKWVNNPEKKMKTLAVIIVMLGFFGGIITFLIALFSSGSFLPGLLAGLFATALYLFFSVVTGVMLYYSAEMLEAHKLKAKSLKRIADILEAKTASEVKSEANTEANIDANASDFLFDEV